MGIRSWWLRVDERLLKYGKLGKLEANIQAYNAEIREKIPNNNKIMKEQSR